MNHTEYLVIYDLSDNRERRRVSKILKSFGIRIQKSVFECTLRKKDKVELIKKLKGLDIKSGFIKIYHLEFRSDQPVIGKKPVDQPGKDDAAFII